MQQQFPDNNGVVRDEISLKEVILSIEAWWKYMLSKWKVLALFGVIGGMLGLVYSLITPTTYKAETSFVLDSKRGESDFSSLAAKFGLGGSSGNKGLFGTENNMIAFLKSRRMGAQTLLTPLVEGQKELLIDRYLQVYGIRNKWKDKRLKNIKFNPFNQHNTLLSDSIVTVIHKSIVNNNLSVVKALAEADIVTVTTVSVDEEFSKKYTETIMQNAATFYINSVTKKSQNNVDILQHQADSVKQILNSALGSVASTSDAIPNLNLAFQRLKVPTQKRLVDVEMNKAILEQLVVNLELAKINLRQETPFIQVIDSPVLPLEQKKIGKVKGITLGVVATLFMLSVYLSLQYFLKLLLKN
ncbi:MAG TPA: hypothetical protein VL098_08020 [Flavipsychrobacter sp.]|nr:hypothetical protein [Flavipsychrobacter sp.]